MSNRTENRKFWASLLMLFVVVALVGYLTFIPVPTDSKDIIITVLGVLLGGASAAMPNLFGSKDGETESLKVALGDLRIEHDKLKGEFNVLKGEYDKLTTMLVARLPVAKVSPPRKPRHLHKTHRVTSKKAALK